MDQPTKKPSNFAAFLNRKKQPGDRRPMFVDGKIAKPGKTDEYPLSLWAFEYTDKATGEVLMGFGGELGNVSPDAEAVSQLQTLMTTQAANGGGVEHAGLTLKPGQVIAFVNKPKPDGKANQKTHYGFVNFGDGTPIAEVSIWLDKDRYGRAYLSGNTQYPQPAKDQTAQAPAPEVDKMVASGIVSRGMPKKAAEKGGRA
jgi:hypothetical protein